MWLWVKVSKLNTEFVAVRKLYTNLVVIQIKHRGLKFPQRGPNALWHFPIDIKKNIYDRSCGTRGNVFCAYSPLFPFSRSTGCPKAWMICVIQGDSVAKGPKLLSIKNSVIEIMTWKFIYTYWERCKTGPVHNRCWNWSSFTSKHTWMRFSKFWNTFPKVSKLTAWISWCVTSLSCSIVQGVFSYTLLFNRPKERSRQALDRLPLVSNFLTNFWMQHFDGGRLSPNSVQNAVWHALNEPVCQYLRKRNPRFSTVYIDNNLGPLARESPCIIKALYTDDLTFGDTRCSSVRRTYVLYERILSKI